MDQTLPAPEPSSANLLSLKNISIGGVVIAAIVVFGLMFFFYGQENAATPSDEELGDALRATESGEVEVPTSQNPVKQVLPEETAYDKTNPFNDAYVNPFE